MIHTNVLQRSREELLEESQETSVRKHSKCYLANVLIGGITGAEVACISEEFVEKIKKDYKRVQCYQSMEPLS